MAVEHLARAKLGRMPFECSTPNVTQGRPGDAEIAGIPVGRELDMLSLPLYRIEPPDVLNIEASRIIPRSPYRLRPLDALQLSVEGTLPDQPINGIFVVEPSGLISLGPGYGKAMVGNLPLEEAAEMIESQLKRVLRSPQVSLSLAEAAGLQQINGQHQLDRMARSTWASTGWFK